MKYTLFILFVCFQSKSFSQNESIAFDTEVIYKMVYQPDRTNNRLIKEEYSELRLNDNVSVFRTVARGKIDSARHAQNGKADNSELPPSFYIENSTDFYYTIVKKQDSVFHYEVLHPDVLVLYYFSMPKPIVEWEIRSDTLTVAGILCQKATANFGGRDWVAWFASDIPVSDGPYKFCGLPGLILSAYDIQEHWRFDVVSIHPNKHGQSWIYAADTSPPKRTTKTNFFKRKADYKDNIFNVLLAEGRFSGVKPEALARVREYYKDESSRNNNWIELHP